MSQAATEVIEALQALSQPEQIEFKAKKYGIHSANALGLTHADLKPFVKAHKGDNELALALYYCGIYEARLLCGKIISPSAISTELLDLWVQDFDSWEICDTFCMGPFARHEEALPKAQEWTEAEEEYVKRAGFVILACYGSAYKQAGNEVFEPFFAPIEREAHDDRVYVKKAISWALRSIGKRNPDLLSRATEVAQRLSERPEKAARWIGKDALRELEKPTLKLRHYPRQIYGI